MEFHVVNENICINEVHILAIGTSSLMKIGDTQSIQMYSTFDTPPESLIIGPFAPIVSGPTGGAIR